MNLRYYQKLIRQVSIGVMSEFKRILVAVDFSLPELLSKVVFDQLNQAAT